MKKFLSRYHPRYIRSLVYMLQASEYSVRDYLHWLPRVENFRTVETRKNLVTTKKALLFLVGASVLLVISYAAALGSFFLFQSPLNALLSAIIVLAAPYIVAYGILIPLFLFNFFIQYPVTRFKIARAHEKLKKSKAIKIAIAGSYGKTSMREILRTVIGQGKRVQSPEGSINTPLGICNFIEGLKGDEEVLIFEFGEYYPGDITELSHLVRPDIGIITGVNEAHLEKFRRIEATTKTIFELAEYMGNKPLYVNRENENVRKAAAHFHILYDRNGVLNWKVEKRKSDLSGTSFDLVQEAVRISVVSKLLGLHHIGPLVAAADIGLRVGLSLENITQGLNTTKAYDHRLEPIYDESGVITLDDSYNGNPDGASAVIDFLASLSGHRRFYVTPGLVEMGVRKEAIHREIGRKLALAQIEKVILIRNSVTPYIESGLQENKYRGEIIWYDTAHEAFSALPVLTAKGDVVLLQNDWPDQYA